MMNRRMRSSFENPPVVSWWRLMAAVGLALYQLSAVAEASSLSNLISQGTEGTRTNKDGSTTCISSLDAIYETEKNVKDDSILRKYILCPNTEYPVALNFAEDGTPLDGQYPIPFGRPNIQVLCGEDGRSENNCRLVRGLVHVGIVDEFGAGTPANNTLLQGITFFRATSVSVIAMIGGHITIRDCIFQRNRNVASIYAVLPQATGGRRLSLTSSTNEIESFLGEQASHQRRLQALNTTSSEYDLHIQVTESAFTETVLGASPGAESTAVIFSAGASVELIDSSIVATTKDAQKVEKMPTLIYMASGFLTLKNNCFVGNDAGITPVIAQQSSVEANSNFYQRASNNLPNTGCEFIAHNVMTDADNLNKGFVCEASDAPVCTSKRPVNYRYPCVSYLDEIYFTESDITDPSIPRTYLLCPNTVFRVGSRHTDEGTPVGGSYPIILGRSNIRVLCGIDGKFGNNCLIRNGVVQVAHFDEFQTGGIPINNALVQGISFSSASSINALISGKGDVVFRDCAFTNNDNVASVYVQNIEPRVRGRRNLEATINHVVENAQRRTQSQSAGSNLLEATLDSCIFENNTIGSALNPVSGLITSYEASLTIADSMIIDTINHATPDYLGYYEVGYLVGNFGGAMKLAKNCFFDNSVTIAPVLNRGSLTAMFNAGRQQLAPSNQSTSELMTERSAKNPGELLYGINDTMTESTNTTWDPPIDHNLARCEFIANIPDNVLGEVNPELITFSCEGFDAEECSHESAPTNAPTLSPTVSPQPSAQPSMQPTMEPSVSLPLTSPEIGIDAAVESSGYRISPSLSVLCFVVFSAYSYMS